MTRLSCRHVGLLVALSLSTFFSNKAAGQALQERSFSPQMFHPAPGPDEFVSVETAVPLRHKGWAVGLFFNYARNQFSILNFDNSAMKAGDSRADLLANSLSLDAWAAFGFFNRFQVALDIPMALFQSGDDFNSPNPLPGGTHVAAASGFAFGDP